MRGLRSGRLRPILLCVVVLVAAAGAAWAAPAWRSGSKPDMAAALGSVPRAALAFSYTDWSDLRTAFPRDVDSGAKLAQTASTRDVSTRSVLAATAEGLQKSMGWSVNDLAWEAYAQSAESSVVVVRFDDGLSMSTVTKGLRSAGYTQQGDTWTVDGSDLRAADVSDLLATVTLRQRDHLMIASDLGSAVRQADRVVTGRAASLAADPAMARTAQALAGSAAVFVQRGELGCRSTPISNPEATAAADAAVKRAGGLATYTASGRGLSDSGGSGFGGQQLAFAMTFADPTIAHRQLDVREALTSGQFIGRTGQVADTLRLREASTHGATVTLDFDHDPDTDAFMSGSGAVLFATC